MINHRYLVHFIIGFMLLGSQTVWADANPQPSEKLLSPSNHMMILIDHRPV